MCYVWGPEVDVAIFLDRSPPYFLWQGLSPTELGAYRFSYVCQRVSSRDMPISAFPSTRATDLYLCVRLLHGSWGSKLRLSYLNSMELLSYHPSPHSPNFFFSFSESESYYIDPVGPELTTLLL